MHRATTVNPLKRHGWRRPAIQRNEHSLCSKKSAKSRGDGGTSSITRPTPLQRPVLLDHVNQNQEELQPSPAKRHQHPNTLSSVNLNAAQWTHIKAHSTSRRISEKTTKPPILFPKFVNIKSPSDRLLKSFLTYDGQQGVGFTAWMQSILYHDFGVVVDSTALDVAIPIYIKSGKPMLTNATRGIIWEADDNHSEFQKVNNDLGFPSDENGEVLFDEIKVKVKKENARTWTVDNAETTARDILAAHEYPDLPFDEPGEFPDDAVKAFKQSIIDHAYKVRAAELEQAMQDAFTGEDDAADPDAPMPSIESNGGKMNRSVSPSGQRSSSSDDDDHDKDDNDVSDESSEDSDQSDSDDDKRPKKIRKSDPASSVSADSVSDADYETDTTWDQKRMIKNQNRAERRAAMEHAS